jgi:hypothetical protein
MVLGVFNRTNGITVIPQELYFITGAVRDSGQLPETRVFRIEERISGLIRGQIFGGDMLSVSIEHVNFPGRRIRYSELAVFVVGGQVVLQRQDV